MKILLKKVKINDPASTHHLAVKDILIDNGLIQKISKTITNPGEKCRVVDLSPCMVSPGWVDSFADFCDPGFEQNETLETGTHSAIHGGYTRACILPNTQPVIDRKTGVEYIIEKARKLPIHIHPIGAISKNTEGRDLAEMYDMFGSGAVAFSDGRQSLQSPALLIKALQYVKAIDTTLIQLPVDTSIARSGLMHEGIISTKLGLPGIPALAEKIMVERDLELVAYTNSKLHFTGVSLPESIDLIKKAKKAGRQVTCSVTPYHLFFCDEDLQSYDTNLKTSPPLRSRNDMLELRKAVLKGDVDCIASHHQPRNWDEKTKEFEYAKYGMIGLQTCFAAVHSVLPEMPEEQVANLFSLNARKIFNLPSVILEEGNMAELTLYQKEAACTFSENNNFSRSANSPFFNRPLTGCVKGIFAKNKLTIF